MAPRPFRGLLLPGLAAVAGIAILVSLGIWQLHRLQWKDALIARVEARLNTPPVPAPPPEEWAGLDLAAEEYRPAKVTGVFDHEAEMHYVTSATEPMGDRSRAGYMIITPLETADDWFVFVNRGFVPMEQKAAGTRTAGQIGGQTTVVGLLRQPFGRTWFMPANDPEANSWFSRLPVEFAQAAGLPAEKVAPYIIDAEFDPDVPGGLPQGGMTVVDFPNNHLQYALTWFSLAIALAVVFVVFARGRLRETRSSR